MSLNAILVDLAGGIVERRTVENLLPVKLLELIPSRHDSAPSDEPETTEELIVGGRVFHHVEEIEVRTSGGETETVYVFKEAKPFHAAVITPAELDFLKKDLRPR